MIQRLIALVMFLSSAALIHPHPHLFMEARYELDMGISGMRGFWVEWTFDQYFTGSIMMDYDLDRNRRFDEAETREVEVNAFSNLENFNYFTFVAEGDSHRGVTEVREFDVRFESQSLVYRFYVPYSVPAGRLNGFTLAGYDPTFFCALSYDDPPVRLSDNRRWRLRVAKRKNPSVQIEYMAEDVRPTATTIEELVITVEAK